MEKYNIGDIVIIKWSNTAFNNKKAKITGKEKNNYWIELIPKCRFNDLGIIYGTNRNEGYEYLFNPQLFISFKKNIKQYGIVKFLEKI